MVKFKAGICVVVFVILNHALVAQDSIAVSNSIFSNLQKSQNGTGDISIYNDVLLYHLIESHISVNKENGLIGYRIQINQWSGQNSRDKAASMQQTFLSKFPDFDKSLVYQEYESPYYKLRIGDFRSRNEAFEFYNQVRRYFPNSYIVKTNIEYPKLIVKNEAEEDN